MAKNRIVFIVWLLLWLAAWARGVGNMAGGILLASVLCAAAEIAAACALRKRLTAQLSAAVSCRKGEELPITVTVANSGLLSCLRVQADVQCRNLLTGEVTHAAACLPAAGHAKAQTVCTLRPRHCGKLELTLTALRVYDMFGLVGAKKPVGLTAPSLVLPDVWPVELTVSERRSPDMDSSEYSMYHPGNDPSETFALREYLPGDRIKNIHWKLSEKTDHLMVRQLGLPVDDSLLLLLDSSADAAPSAAEREALGEAAVSVSAALCGESIPHRLAWLDRASGELTFREVTCLEELTQSLPDVLSSEIRCEEPSVLHHLMAAASEYAHIIVVTLRPAPPAADSRFSFLSVSPETLSGEEGVYLAL